MFWNKGVYFLTYVVLFCVNFFSAKKGCIQGIGVCLNYLSISSYVRYWNMVTVKLQTLMHITGITFSINYFWLPYLVVYNALSSNNTNYF